MLVRFFAHTVTTIHLFIYQLDLFLLHCRAQACLVLIIISNLFRSFPSLPFFFLPSSRPLIAHFDQPYPDRPVASLLPLAQREPSIRLSLLLSGQLLTSAGRLNSGSRHIDNFLRPHSSSFSPSSSNSTGLEVAAVGPIAVSENMLEVAVGRNRNQTNTAAHFVSDDLISCCYTPPGPDLALLQLILGIHPPRCSGLRKRENT